MPSYELTPCTACGDRDSRLVADSAALRAELEELWEFHTRRLRPGTPPEHLADRVAFSQPIAFRLVECAGCGLLYRNPVERAHEVHDLYAGEEPAPEVLRSLHDTQHGAYRAQAERLTRIFGRAGMVVEVGSYVGGFLSAARDAGWQATGVDVNPMVNAWVRASGHHVIDGELHQLDAPPADVIAFWNCFDQLADPAGALRSAHARVRPGGMLVIRVPNGAYYAGHRERRSPLARAALAWNNLLAFPYRFGFAAPSLRRALDRAGFAVERIVGDTLVPLADRHTRGWARAEERVLKRVQRTGARLRPAAAPWMEFYARRR